MEKPTVRKFQSFCLGVLLCGLLAGFAQGETFQLLNGQSISGAPTSFSEKGVLFKLEDGSYSERTAWDKFTQEALKKMAEIPKAAAFTEAYIEPTEEEKAAQKAPLVIKSDYAKLEHPPKQPLFSALMTSSIGLLALLLIYAGNVYAGYEISIFRARPAALVCGVSAVLPFLGPIIFLCMPTAVEDKSDIVQEPMHEKETYHVGEPPVEGAEAAPVDAGPQLPPTKHFVRGQYTFNRRFFETNFPGFFTVVRREADKDLVLIFKSARGEHTVQRISRVSANELHLQVNKGHASEEVMVQFGDIKEVILKHKDA